MAGVVHRLGAHRLQPGLGMGEWELDTPLRHQFKHRLCRVQGGLDGRGPVFLYATQVLHREVHSRPAAPKVAGFRVVTGIQALWWYLCRCPCLCRARYLRNGLECARERGRECARECARESENRCLLELASDLGRLLCGAQPLSFVRLYPPY